MTEYRVKITARALSDMEAIYEYIADDLTSTVTVLRVLYNASDLVTRLRENL